MNETCFAVIGGDLRSAYVADALIEERRAVVTAGLELSGVVDPAHINTLEEALSRADVVILPLPLLDKTGRLQSCCSSERLDVFGILSRARGETELFAGMVPPAVREHAERCGKRLSDYYLREELQIKNAVPTAEGTVELLMNRLPVTVSGSAFAVTGFGRTGSALALLLRAMGAQVTVYARKSAARALAESLGLRALPLARLRSDPYAYAALVNTIPARVINRDVLERMPAGALVVDLASAPGGVDFAYAAAHGIAAEAAGSLPGRVAPKTAGLIIKNTVMTMLAERGTEL
ncbi:MAG: dipicolinate synthase subunit DpsA [Oscillospiraceae bacterium]|nr:dipicolinate synthase subunit DpsA [Oscillospiraceae bacterium]